MKKYPLSLMMLSEGNLPSRAANSMQVAKMSQAFHNACESFSAVTLGDVHSLLVRSSFDFKEWYGLRQDVRFVRLPLVWRKDAPFPPFYRCGHFPQWAVRYARWKRPDIVYTRSMDIAMQTARSGIPTLLEAHEMAWEGLFHDAVFSQPSFLGLVTISDILAEYYHEQGLPSGKTLVLPLGVDIERYASPPSRQQARQKLDLPDGPLAVYVGHLIPEKGIETILETAALLPEVNFLVVGGWDADVEKYTGQARQQGIPNVTFAGFQPNVLLPWYLAAASVLLLPFNATAMRARWVSPLKLFEYMASGTPVIGASIPAIRRYLNEGNSFLYNPEVQGDMAAKIMEALHEPEQALKRGKAAREGSVSYSWDNRVAAILDYATENSSGP